MLQPILDLSGKHIGKMVRITCDWANLTVRGRLLNFEFEMEEHWSIGELFPEVSVTQVIVHVDGSRLMVYPSAEFEVTA